MQGPSESSANLLTHPLEEPLPVVADCSMTSSGGGVAAFAGWSQERVVWSSRELPYVATYNEVRGREAVVLSYHSLRQVFPSHIWVTLLVGPVLEHSLESR